MLHFFDRASLLAAPSLTSDPELRSLLHSRVSLAKSRGLLDMTEIVVIDALVTETDLVETIGFSPLVDLDGRRFGNPAFCSRLDYAARVSPSYHEAIVAMGNSGFAFQLLVHDDADRLMVNLCKSQA